MLSAASNWKTHHTKCIVVSTNHVYSCKTNIDLCIPAYNFGGNPLTLMFLLGQENAGMFCVFMYLHCSYSVFLHTGCRFFWTCLGWTPTTSSISSTPCEYYCRSSWLINTASMSSCRSNTPSGCFHSFIVWHYDLLCPLVLMSPISFALEVILYLEIFLPYQSKVWTDLPENLSI